MTKPLPPREGRNLHDDIPVFLLIDVAGWLLIALGVALVGTGMWYACSEAAAWMRQHGVWQ